jgi:putative ABC transport system permease protein
MWNRLRRWIGRRQFEAELGEEIRIHREMERDYRAAGGEGRYFGSEVVALEESRDAWGLAWLDSLAQDVRYAARGIRKAPGFALTVISTIGLGLGLITTLFTVLNTYVFRTIAVSDAQGLYEFWWESTDGTWRATWSQFQALRRENHVFADVAAYGPLYVPLDGRPAIGETVSGNYFALLAPGAHLGRFIEPDDADVVVLSYNAWRNSFGADPNIIGRPVRLRGRTVEVIGVAAPGFTGVGEVVHDFWVTGGPSMGSGPPPLVRLLCRLKPGITPEAASSAVLAWAKAETSDLPPDRRAASARIASRATPIPYSPRMLAALAPVFAAFGLVLAIACANVSNMMLARALARQREIGIRVSLGAGRARLVRQLLTESLLLALPAAAAGIAISQATMRLAIWLLLHTIPPAFAWIMRIPSIETDWRVFTFVLLASAGAALLFGLVPALQATRARLVEATRGDFSSDHRPSRLRNVLMVGQVTVCTLLIVCSAVALRSQRRVSAQDIRIRTEGMFELLLAKALDTSGVERLRASPGIEAVAAVWRTPIANELVKLAVIPSGGKAEVAAGYNFVSPEYFSLLRIPLVRGRLFSADEARAGADVVVISDATARRFWPGEEPLGKVIEIPSKRQADRRSTRLPTYSSAHVIGIVGDLISGLVAVGLDPSCLYFPTVAGSGPESLLVGVTRGKEAGRSDIRTALDQIAPDLADQINPLDEIRATTIYPFRIAFWIAGLLGGLAILLTVSGIYGVLSYLVSQRTKEIGIRMALGASGGAVVRMVVSQCMRFVAVGTAIGVALALIAAPVFANRVEAVQPYDATAYLGTVLLIVAAALGASFRPARRAVAVDPLWTLRCD